MGAGRLILGSVAALALALSLAGCNSNDVNRTAFDGVYFKAKSKRISDDYKQFIVSVHKASLSLDGAREAAEYEGTKYCLSNFLGTSRIKWTVGPETPPEQLVLTDDILTYQGECNP